ncbi:hypothetical protein CLOSTMETH_02766, partial [[Clostridium] methylpentosum DSM 5476]
KKQRGKSGGIQEYIKNQLKEDEMSEQLTIQPKGPFTRPRGTKGYARISIPRRSRGMLIYVENHSLDEWFKRRLVPMM